ncbi:MAG: aminotransferase class V-fold PLP-dependent enzyme [Actinobacteria bacterium]|nr:aminotransferase class V-fold PLP-dependent enzyme [Actinomycetota bacterium]MSY52298.1 aminotransferase class V-fold PLP-dependent enzyme [Actinomycetota bacterium]MSY87941.1 aminotransferase class V-fold PLP-dependent enzyme [Actinomycetota bacterium]MTA50805.1 aminotransferase class V-fold PLP-dependent enzyme [Actinomycetota bacterium]
MSTYLDHAATTPMSDAARLAMIDELGNLGNASSLHASGRRSRKVVEEAREAIASAVGATPGEIVLTGSGTEANNLAVKGLYWKRIQEDPANNRIISSSIEHHAVMDPIQWLVDHEGAEVTWISVNDRAQLNVEELVAEIERDPKVALVSIMFANNEVGTLQPLVRVIEAAHKYGIPVHTDAVQAFGKVPLSFKELDLDAMTISGHKIGGPLGIGALIVKKNLKLTPVLHGGGQERDIRSGTLDTPAIRALGVAATEAAEQLTERALRMVELRRELTARVLAEVPDARANGDELTLPGIAHFTFAGAEGDALLLLLDAQGIESSTGSACSAGVPRPSHVLLAMGMSEVDARASLRFSLGFSSTSQDVDALVSVIGGVVERARKAGQVSKR